MAETEAWRCCCRFIVRDYQYSENEVKASRKELTQLSAEKKNQFGPLVRWLKVNFGEALIAWMHIKALPSSLNLFSGPPTPLRFVKVMYAVPDVWRVDQKYGLPVNFQAMIVAPHKKLQKKLRDVLNQLYGHLDGSTTGNTLSKSDIVDLPGLSVPSDVFPYVFYKVTIDMVE